MIIKRHTALPSQLQGILKKPRKRIVFKEVQKCRISSNNFESNKRSSNRSASTEKSIHRINSKQKPIMQTPNHKVSIFQASTHQPYKHSQISNLQSPTPKNNNKANTTFLYVSDILKQKQFTTSYMSQSKQKSQLLTTSTAKHYQQQYQQHQQQHQQQSNAFKQPSYQFQISKIINMNSSPPLKQHNNSTNNKHQELKYILQQNKQWISYEGQTKGNKMNGIGTLYLTNGDKFVGQFHNNQIHGFGTYYYGLSQPFAKIHAIWQQSQLVQYI